MVALGLDLLCVFQFALTSQTIAWLLICRSSYQYSLKLPWLRFAWLTNCLEARITGFDTVLIILRAWWRWLGKTLHVALLVPKQANEVFHVVTVLTFWAGVVTLRFVLEARDVWYLLAIRTVLADWNFWVIGAAFTLVDKGRQAADTWRCSRDGWRGSTLTFTLTHHL